MHRVNFHRSSRLGSKFAALTIYALGLVTPLVVTLSAMAAADEESKSYDARLERFPGSVTLDSGGTALTWLLFIILTGLCIGVLFKNANRTHLD